MKVDNMVTTIQLPRSVLEELKSAREHPRQTYAELILKMVKTFKQSKKPSQFDAFLMAVQQAKMKELWDNPADEAWEHV
jgi:hypothetical protein